MNAKRVVAMSTVAACATLNVRTDTAALSKPSVTEVHDRRLDAVGNRDRHH